MPATPVLLWGDPRVGNMIFAEDHTVAAALDWETAMIGPAARDVAHWLFFDEFQTDAVGIERLPGWPDRATTIARYESLSGRHLGDLEFFDVMESLFMATTLIRQADARVARGLAPPDDPHGPRQHRHPDAGPRARSPRSRSVARLPRPPGRADYHEDTVTELERNLLAAPQEAHAKVEIYSGVARLARTVWASEVKVGRQHAHDRARVVPPDRQLPRPLRAGRAWPSGASAAIGLTTRYVGNDTNLIMENCLLDMGSMVAHLRDRGYEKVVLIGNSGGASIVPYYQAQAVSPSVTSPPGGGPDLTTAGLDPGRRHRHVQRPPVPGPALHRMARPGHRRRAPALRARRLARHVPTPHNGPPFSAEFIARYRDGQRARNRRISAWAEGMLEALLAPGHFPPGLEDLAFIVQGTTADLRFLDGTIDPSDREIGVSLWGPPAVANYLPAGIGRCTTLRSWLNQWSLDHTLGDSLRWLPEITCPVLVGVGTADPVVTPQMARQIYDAATSSSARVLVEVQGRHPLLREPTRPPRRGARRAGRLGRARLAAGHRPGSTGRPRSGWPGPRSPGRAG